MRWSHRSMPRSHWSGPTRLSFFTPRITLIAQQRSGVCCCHYCKILLMQHYDQRPFDETVCDAIIANGGVKNHQKRCKSFAMMYASNTVQVLVACAMKGIRLIHSNCLRWGRTTETGSHNNVCAMQDTRLIHSNCLRWGRTTEMGSHINVCVIYGIRLTRTKCFRLGNTTETVQLNKMCVICSVQFTWMNCLRWAKRTQTSHVNKMCVIRGKQPTRMNCLRL